MAEKQTGAKRPRAITIADLYAFRLIGSPEMSPDGSRCVVVVQRADVGRNAYYTDLYLIELDSGELRRLTEGDYSDSNPRWSPDGESIAFLSSRSGTGQIHLLPMRGGDTRKLTSLEGRAVLGFEWNPDSTTLTALVRGLPPDAGEAAQEERKRKRLSSPTRVIDTVLYRIDGEGYFGAERAQLARVDAATGEVKVLTRLKGGVDSFAVSPSGEEIAYLTSPDILRHWENVLQVIPATGGKVVRTIPTRPGGKGGLAWSPDGKLLAYLGHESQEDPWGQYNEHPWVVPADGSEWPRDVAEGVDQSFAPTTLADVVGPGGGALAFTPDSAALDVFALEHGAQRPVRIPVTGGKPLPLLTGHIHAYAKSREVAGRLVVTFQSPTEPGDAYLVTPGARRPRRLTELNADLLSELTLTAPEARWIRCAETGRRIQGWVLKPPGFREGRQYPLLLEIHGGPHMQYGAGFFHEMHWLAAQGWVVVFSNPAGSHGYGEAHLQALRHHWGEADFPELMGLVDAVIAEGYVDPKRLGVTGGSYGGYMTNWVVTHTDRFRVAATQRCVSNLVSMAGSSDFPMAPDAYFAGNAWSRPEELWRLSPIRLVEQIRTPLLILHSEGDLRCNIEQAEQLYSALKVLRRKTKFVRFPREASHGLSRGGPPDLRTKRLEELTAWLAEGLSAKR